MKVGRRHIGKEELGGGAASVVFVAAIGMEPTESQSKKKRSEANHIEIVAPPPLSESSKPSLLSPLKAQVGLIYDNGRYRT